MLVSQAKVRYQNHGFPWMWQLYLHVHNLPAREELRYEQKGRLYYANKEGFVSFFAWSGLPDSGFGGASFKLTMKDGSEVTLIGPWSSNACAMDRAGFERSFSCTWNEEKYGGNISGHITVEKAKQILQDFGFAGEYKICEMVRKSGEYNGCYMFPRALDEGHQLDWDSFIGIEV